MQTEADNEPKAWPIIVGGSHRSGTTLVRRLLNAHPDIFCPGEIKFHKDLLRQFPNDPLAIGRLGASISSLGLDAEEWLDTFGQAFIALYQRATAKAGKTRWADKNPENCLNIGHWDRLLDGRCLFVMVVRHPYDILCSMQEIGMPKVLPLDVSGRSRHIASYLQSGQAFCEMNPDRSFVLRYEDLLENPDDHLSRLFGFLGESKPPDLMAQAFNGAKPDGLGDPKAGSFGSLDPSRVGRWRAELSASDIALVQEPLNWILHRWGYTDA
ncbi:MAG: sulfotransferase [Chitinophagaceae bacterium]